MIRKIIPEQTVRTKLESCAAILCFNCSLGFGISRCVFYVSLSSCTVAYEVLAIEDKGIIPFNMSCRACRPVNGSVENALAIVHNIDISSFAAPVANIIRCFKLFVSSASVVAETAGYYVASSDGYETVAGIDGIKEFRQEDVEALNKAEPAAVPADTVGKLVTSFSWYLVCTVDEKAIYGIETGGTVGVSFLNSSAGTIRMHVDAINANKQNGTVTLVLRSNKMDAAVAALRKEKVKVIVEQYEGYVVDPKAVRTVDGATGVYVKLGNIVKFRNIDIAYSDDTMILAVSPDGESGYLKQYDEIIIEGTDLYDGKNID